MIVRIGAAFVAQPEAWLTRDDTIVFSKAGGRGGFDVMSVTPGDAEPQPYLVGPAWEGGVSFSPDGRWVAYVSDESGRFEVYVQSHPVAGGKWQISTQGGKGPIWSREGREIFYTHGNRMMVVDVETDPGFSPGAPRELFEYDFDRYFGPWPDYDVTPDGKRFLMFQRSSENPPPRQINIVTDFAAMLARVRDSTR
jgi:Tol biopolymer transport system component